MTFLPLWLSAVFTILILITLLWLLSLAIKSGLERTLTKTKPGYEEYMARTNAFFPWFPKK